MEKMMLTIDKGAYKRKKRTADKGQIHDAREWDLKLQYKNMKWTEILLSQRARGYA